MIINLDNQMRRIAAVGCATRTKDLQNKHKSEKKSKTEEIKEWSILVVKHVVYSRLTSLQPI